MSKMEKAIVLAAFAFQLAAIAFVLSGPTPPVPISPFIFGTLISLIAVVLILRDLYKRQFPNPNSKLTWLLVMVFTSGIGAVFYAYRHAFRPRGGSVDA